MMFLQWLAERWKKIDPSRIDDRSRLVRVDRDAYKYQEGNYAVIVQVELQSGNPDVIVYSATIEKWLPPHEQQPITNDQKQHILRQVCKYLENRNITYTVM